MITYAVLKDEILKNLEMDGSDAENVARFNVENNVNSAFRSVVFQFPKKFLKSAAQYFVSNLLTTGIHETAKDTYLRIIDVYVDFFNDGIGDNFVAGVKATHRSNMYETYIGRSFLQPTYDDRVSIADKQEITIKPTPPGEIANGLTIFAVGNVTISDSVNCPLDISLKDAIVFHATHLCAMTDGYSPDLGKFFLTEYQNVLKTFVGEI